MKSFRIVVGNEVRFSLSPNSPCPCGSGRATSNCCLTANGIFKTPAQTTPRGPKTGNSNNACYASRVADCSDKLSREHYISESLLHHLNQSKDLTVSGLPWLKGESKILSPNSLSSKILCDRHNSALSSLDSIAVNLFQAFDEKDVVGSGKQLIHLFSGHDLERWLLKMLCGIISSNILIMDCGTDMTIPNYWLDILFYDENFPELHGLYVCKSRGHQFKGPYGLKISAITNRNRITGMGLWVCGYELVLSMAGFPNRSFDGREFVYRPLEIYATDHDFEKNIMFSWDGPADLGTVSVSI